MSGLTMARPNQLPTRPEMTKEQIDSATYAGSPEHKVTEWWGGLPQAWEGKKGKANRPKKEKTSICRKVTAEERDEATEWVREALRKDQFRYYEGDKTFPNASLPLQDHVNRCLCSVFHRTPLIRSNSC